MPDQIDAYLAEVDALVDVFETETACCLVDRRWFYETLAYWLSKTQPKKIGLRDNQTHMAKLVRQMQAVVTTYDKTPLYPKAAKSLTNAFGGFQPPTQQQPLEMLREMLRFVLDGLEKADAELTASPPESGKQLSPYPAIVILGIGQLYRNVIHEYPVASGPFLAWAGAVFKLLEPEWKPDASALRMRVQRGLHRADLIAQGFEEILQEFGQ